MQPNTIVEYFPITASPNVFSSFSQTPAIYLLLQFFYILIVHFISLYLHLMLWYVLSIQILAAINSRSFAFFTLFFEIHNYKNPLVMPPRNHKLLHAEEFHFRKLKGTIFSTSDGFKVLTLKLSAITCVFNVFFFKSIYVQCPPYSSLCKLPQ